MEKYIGTKIIQGEPMTAADAEVALGRKVDTSNADAEGNGYLVQYEDGYTSWSPKKQFEDAYRRIDDMSFGLAIEAMKRGYRVCRQGWNGKNMYLSLLQGGGWRDGYRTQDFIYMKTAQDTVVPWLASQTDMLADDWQLVLGSI